MKVLLLLVFFAFCTASAQCDAILKNGIHDEKQKLDDYSRYELVMEIVEASASGSKGTMVPGLGPVGDFFKASGSYSDKDYHEVREDSTMWGMVKKASDLIVGAWSQCIASNSNGVSHRIIPIDGIKFFYKVVFTPGGDNDATVVNFLVTGAKCKTTLKRGVKIDSRGTTLECSRNKSSETVGIALDASRGTRNLEPIIFHPFNRKIIPPALVSGLCFRHTSRGGAGLVDTGWVCAARGQSSAPLRLGDDTGYKQQTLELLVKNGDTEVCFEHTRRSPASGLVTSNLICSSKGVPSAPFVIGDDTGWKDQQLRLVVRGPGTYCLTHSHSGSGGTTERRSCFSQQAPGTPLFLGDDTGYRGQILVISVGR